jgi:hypothetical protein
MSLKRQKATVRSGTVLGSHSYAPAAVFRNLCLGTGLVTGSPAGLSGTQAGSAAVANGLVADGLPPRPTVLTPATKPMSSGLDGPRLDAADEVPSYPAPAADGRGWNHCGSGLPLASEKLWPSRAEPTSFPWE